MAETDLGEIVETVWYNGKEVHLEYDYNDTTGKGYYASVGYLNKKWHDTETRSFKQLEEDGNH